MWTLLHLVRADLLDRCRGRRFGVMAVALMAVAALCLPAEGASYLTLSINGHRGHYTSAWVGTLVAMLNSALLALPAFFIVRDAVQRDVRTGVQPLIASTPVGATTYVAGKVLSNSLLLCSLVFLVALFAGVIQIVRAEDLQLNVLALVVPTLVIAVPTMVLVSAISVLFECLPGLRGVFGNVVYLVGFILLSGVTAPAASSPASPDVFGVRPALSAMTRAAQPLGDEVGGVHFGVQLHPTPPGSFIWQDLSWWPESLTGRWPLLWVVLGLVLLAGRAYAWSGTQRRARSTAKRGSVLPVPAATPPVHSSLVLHSSIVLEQRVSVGARLLSAELYLQVRLLPWWWFLGTLTLGVLCLTVPVGVPLHLVWVISWVWPLQIWSNLRLPQHADAAAMIFATEHAWFARWSSVTAAGVLLTAAALLPGLVRAVLDETTVTTMGWVTGVAFVPVLSAALLTLGLPQRAVQGVYLLLWYLGPVSGLPALDFLSVRTAQEALPWWVAWLVLCGVIRWARPRP